MGLTTEEPEWSEQVDEAGEGGGGISGLYVSLGGGGRVSDAGLLSCGGGGLWRVGVVWRRLE